MAILVSCRPRDTSTTSASLQQCFRRSIGRFRQKQTKTHSPLRYERIPGKEEWGTFNFGWSRKSSTWLIEHVWTRHVKSANDINQPSRIIRHNDDVYVKKTTPVDYFHQHRYDPSYGYERQRFTFDGIQAAWQSGQYAKILIWNFITVNVHTVP